jgi:hypothetical protein
VKITRNKNIISIEIEDSDCPPGKDKEFIADAIMAGMIVMQQNPTAWKDITPRITEKHPELITKLSDATSDLLERWEE